MTNKFCRICWNTEGWRKPSGAIRERSFAARLGFGLEEWLFNYEWLVNGTKYGFLQPIGRFRNRYENQRFSVALYTRHEGFTLLVAEISNVYVPELDELTNAFYEMTERGWIDSDARRHQECE